jgi:hypothetical protein
MERLRRPLHQPVAAVRPCLVAHGLAAGMDSLAAEGLEENALKRGAMKRQEGGIEPQVAWTQAGQDLASSGPQLELLLDAAGRGDGSVEADPPQGEHGGQAADTASGQEDWGAHGRGILERRVTVW